jgi:LysM repeat protein
LRAEVAEENGLPIRNLTLGLCTLLATTAFAQKTYTVRNGDFDWAIARRYGISVKKLHSMNSGIDWDALRIGSKINVPRSKEHHGGYTVEKHVSTPHVHVHWVQEGENDWIIAHRAGITLGVLKSLNPDVKLSMLHPGQTLRVPGSKRSEAVVHRIRSTRVAVNGDNVTIRRGPGTGHDSICTVDEGTHAAVLDREGDWYQLRFPKGTVGWVRGDLLKPLRVAVGHHRRHHSDTYLARRSRRHRHGAGSSPEENSILAQVAGSNPILAKAKSLRGVRYVWGEASRSGTDCSGFTSQVFRSQGIRLPRTSREQSHVGQKVRYGEMKPGDLVFFHTTRGKRVSHVGIYIGRGKFIHASSGGGKVQVNDLSSGYYQHRLVGARRVKSSR